MRDWCYCPCCGERIGWDDFDETVICPNCLNEINVADIEAQEDDNDEEEI